MDALLPFVIPFSGLGAGVHEFDFQVEKHFFDNFESSPVKEGKVDVKLYFDKRSQMFELIFDINGVINSVCDRCLESFNLPIKATHALLVKFADEGSEDAEIIFIPRGSKSINVAKYIYEFILLSIPMIKTHADEDCDEEMMKYLNKNQSEIEENEPTENPLWDGLKGFKIK